MTLCCCSCLLAVGVSPAISPLGWKICFEKLLIPLLEGVQKYSVEAGPPVRSPSSSSKSPNNSSTSKGGPAAEGERALPTYDLRLKAATLVFQTFLHHLDVLCEMSDFHLFWLKFVGSMERYMKHGDAAATTGGGGRSGALSLHFSESLKNLLLVMHSTGVFAAISSRTGQDLLTLTWAVVDSFRPELRVQLQEHIVATGTVTNRTFKAEPNRTNSPLAKQQNQLQLQQQPQQQPQQLQLHGQVQQQQPPSAYTNGIGTKASPTSAAQSSSGLAPFVPSASTSPAFVPGPGLAPRLTSAPSIDFANLSPLNVSAGLSSQPTSADSSRSPSPSPAPVHFSHSQSSQFHTISAPTSHMQPPQQQQMNAQTQPLPYQPPQTQYIQQQRNGQQQQLQQQQPLPQHLFSHVPVAQQQQQPPLQQPRPAYQPPPAQQQQQMQSQVHWAPAASASSQPSNFMPQQHQQQQPLQLQSQPQPQPQPQRPAPQPSPPPKYQPAPHLPFQSLSTPRSYAAAQQQPPHMNGHSWPAPLSAAVAATAAASPSFAVPAASFAVPPSFPGPLPPSFPLPPPFPAAVMHFGGGAASSTAAAAAAGARPGPAASHMHTVTANGHGSNNINGAYGATSTGMQPQRPQFAHMQQPQQQQQQQQSANPSPMAAASGMQRGGFEGSYSVVPNFKQEAQLQPPQATRQ